MNQEDQIDLALECGMAVSRSGNGYWDNIDQLAAYTAAVETPLQARIVQLEEALNAECGDRCNAEYNPCAARQVLNETPSTWLSEHDKEVAAKERERCAVLCEGLYGALRGDCAAAIRILKNE